MKALVFLVRRLAFSLALIAAVASLTFLVSRTLPGDPARILVGPQASESDVARARTLYGLDASLGAQYARFWQRLVHRPSTGAEHQSCKSAGALHVDLGWSHRSRKGVAELIAQRAPRSLELATVAAVLQLVFGVTLGTLSGRRRGSTLDEISVAVTLLTVSAPTFVIGVLLQYVLAHRLGWLPLDGGGGDPAAIVLPALTLGIYGAAFYARLVREELGRAIESERFRAARARGASTTRALVVHAWRSALPSVLTLFVLELGALIGGAIVT
ncbi:MAG: ABC transporter permease, partial [Deltaproteobacteria bacterium]|nr:ABC transporter permease [Deltaproteobacteria bacterium]